MDRYLFFSPGKERREGRYQLRSVIVHHGSADSGHYATYSLVDESSKRSWMYFSDERVVEADEAQVLASQAYMLFYERVI